ncbi:MAG: ABC transporter permease subunit [Dehalococcoidia bacterium]|nr:ABC transporter permease subunit [Dehalococcoidia bacterium]
MTTATISSNSKIATRAATRRTGFIDILASEWSKLATLRATQLTLGLGFLLSVATTAIACIALGTTQDDWSPDFSPVTTSMIGVAFGVIVFTVFGVMAVSREYASGTIRLTLTATPARGRVFLAKFALVGTMLLVAGLASTISMFYAGQALLGAYGMPTASLADPDAARMVLGLGVAMPFFPLIGFAFGVLFRSTAGGITTALGLHWLPQIFGQLVSESFQENVLSLLPSNGMDTMTSGHIQHSPAFPDPMVGAVVAATWFAVIVGAAYLAFVRRDA